MVPGCGDPFRIEYWRIVIDRDDCWIAEDISELWKVSKSYKQLIRLRDVKTQTPYAALIKVRQLLVSKITSLEPYFLKPQFLVSKATSIFRKVYLVVWALFNQITFGTRTPITSEYYRAGTDR